ncbi:MAG: 1-acyl-sn-glycerol-3-phosphate acyltransferase [Deltaproteobacteria bacterium]|nr:1-acyl-sn-glycerol-3-phosphate acyltransferase [Deltaproteobacteria bacterium]
MRARDRERVLSELTSRVVEETAKAGRVEEALADAVYHEQRRLKEDRSKTRDEELGFWRDVRDEMRRASERALLDQLKRVVARYGNEICGQFDERVYNSVTRAGEPMLGLLLNAVSPKRIMSELFDERHLPRFDDSVVLQGEIPLLHKLRERGTLILVPTHVSNLDSIAVGYALWKLGLPPFLYGAGLNLFSNQMLGFFMRNLGAYTVDRRKQDPLYKRVLKEYCTLTLENGYDNIFFPGGTRSRAGAVEKKLKLGLLGCGLPAYTHNLQAGKRDKERFYIIPATLSFQLVLEAETLIDDFLKEQGKARYIITDDEFSRPKRVFDFLTQLLSLDSKIFFTIGRPIDPCGNAVDDEGESLDPCGRRIDATRELWVDGKPAVDEQRDAELTREVGERLTEAYARDTVIQCTHLTAHATLNLLRKANAGVDFVRLLRGGGRADDVPLRELHAEVRRLLDELRGLNKRDGVRLGPIALDRDAEDVVADGLRHFSIYHAQPAVQRKGDRVSSGDRSLLFYYSNRLEGYRLERGSGLRSPLTPDHRALAKGA